MKKHSILEEAKQLASQGKYNEAIRCLDNVTGGHVRCVNELLLRARIILLGDEDNRCELSGVVKILKKALRIDPDNLDTLVDLGFFYSRVMDDDKKGLVYLERACTISCGFLQSILEGFREIEESKRKLGKESSRSRRLALILKELAKLKLGDPPSDFTNEIKPRKTKAHRGDSTPKEG